MHFESSTALTLLLFLITGFSINSMENTSKTQAHTILPLKKQRKPHEYDAFIAQFELQKEAQQRTTKIRIPIKKQKAPRRKRNEYDALLSKFELNKQREAEPVAAAFKKTEAASNLLAIQSVLLKEQLSKAPLVCTCHKTYEDPASLN